MPRFLAILPSISRHRTRTKAEPPNTPLPSTSGFQPASTTKTRTEPLSEKIRKIDRGPNSGQIVIWVRRVPRASSYEIRYAAASGPTPTQWTSVGVPQVKTPATVTGLTPGTTYNFQARALTREGYTDWTDSISFISA